MTIGGISMFSRKVAERSILLLKFGLNAMEKNVLKSQILHCHLKTLLISAIEKNWDFLNRQIDKSFKGEKTIVKDLEKKEGDKYV